MFSKKEETVKKPRVLVVGAGIIGVTTAYHFLKAGYDVTIFSKDEKTNSDVAALWRPFDARPEELARAFSEKTYSDVFDIYYQHLIHSPDEPSPGISFSIDVEYFAAGTGKPKWMETADQLLKEKIELLEKDKNSDDEKKRNAANYLLDQLKHQQDQISDILKNAPQHPTRPEVYASIVPLMDSTFYKKWLLAECKKMSGRDVVIQEVKSLEEEPELEKLAEEYDVILNCTGEQARNLVADADTVPVRGVVVVTELPSELSYSIGVEPNLPLDGGKPVIAYAIRRPESDTLVLGGTYVEPEKGAKLPKEPQPSSQEEKEKDAEAIFNNIIKLIPNSENINFKTLEILEGFRCKRDEIYSEAKIVVVNNKIIVIGGAYGHGGGGYSVSHGAADHLLKIVKKLLLELNQTPPQSPQPNKRI